MILLTRAQLTNLFLRRPLKRSSREPINSLALRFEVNTANQIFFLTSDNFYSALLLNFILFLGQILNSIFDVYKKNNFLMIFQCSHVSIFRKALLSQHTVTK